MSTTRKQRLEWAEICSKQLLLPDATKFQDVFRSVYLNREEAPTDLPIDRDGSAYPTGVNAWCHRHLKDGPYVSYFLGPHPSVLEKIVESDVVGGTKHFSIVDRDDNVSLVIVDWDQILGSRWLAFIDTDSIPEVPS